MIDIKVIPVGYLRANCYICSDAKKNAVVIDPGEDPQIIAEAIEAENLSLQKIMLTHGHFDHVCAVKELKEKYPDAPILIHEEDYKRYKSGRKIYQRYVGLCFEDLEMPEEVEFIKDGEILSTGDMSFKVIHTPGHTKGSVSFLEEANKILFTGDTLFKLSIGRTDLGGGDLTQLLDSIKKKLFTLDDSIVVYPGHERETSVGYEKANNPYFQNDFKWL